MRQLICFTNWTIPIIMTRNTLIIYSIWNITRIIFSTFLIIFRLNIIYNDFCYTLYSHFFISVRLRHFLSFLSLSFKFLIVHYSTMARLFLMVLLICITQLRINRELSCLPLRIPSKHQSIKILTSSMSLGKLSQNDILR